MSEPLCMSIQSGDRKKNATVVVVESRVCSQFTRDTQAATDKQPTNGQTIIRLSLSLTLAMESKAVN